MKIKTTQLGLLIILLIFGTVAVTSALNLWVTENTKEAAKFEDGEFAGQADPADIRGSYTFEDIYNNFGVPIEDLGVAFGAADPANYASFKTNELEAIYGELPEGKEVGTSSVRYFVALYKGLPISLTEETYLPRPAVEILKAKAKLTPEKLAELEKIVVDLPSTQTQTTTNSETTAITESVPSTKDPSASEGESEYRVNANTSFNDLLDWGVSKENVEKAIGVAMPSGLNNIKNYLIDQGLEFGDYKSKLQALVDEARK